MSIAEGFLRPLKFVCCVFAGFALAGCSSARPDTGEALESQSGALSATMIRTLGFESLSDWHVWGGSTPTLALSTTHTEGSSSLSVTKGGWMQVESRVLDKEQAAPNSFGYSVRIPAGSTGWLGDTQLSINAPSVGIYSQVVGTVALSGPGQFQRVQFTLSNALKAQLNNNYTDLQFRIAINVPTTATQAYLLDQLTFGTVCDSNPVIDDNNPCTDDSCDPLLGVRHLPRPNGSACSDGNACTQVDACSAGACVGSNPVACAPASRCHDAGECDWVSGVCDYPLEDDPSSCREDLTIRVPRATSYPAYAVVANGELDLRDQVTVRAPVANVGATWTHIGNDASFTDVYSKPLVTVGDRSVLQGMLRTGAGSTVSSSASVGDGISAYLFEPLVEHTITFDFPALAQPNVTVELDQSHPLAPGGYGHLSLQPGARLLLSSGDYYFDALDAVEPGSAFVLNERKGPVRIFVNAPFAFRGSVTSTSVPAELTLGVLGAGEVHFESPFQGTLIAPDADLVLAPLNGEKHVAAFFAKNITVDAGVIVEAPPRDRSSCRHSEFRDAGSAECTGHDLEIVAHQGVTRALFEREEALGTGKRVEPVEDFTFTFNEPVSLDRARSAVQILSVSCPAEVLKAGCTHDVALEVTAVGSDGKSVRFSNDNDPFLPGCRYELRVDDAPLTAGNECLAEPARLAFLSLSPADGPVLAYETSELRHDPRNHKVAALEFAETISWQADELFRERLSALGLRPGIDSFAPEGPVRETGFASNAESVFYRQKINGVSISGYGYSVQRDRTTGRVLHVTGRAATDVTPPGNAVVSEAAALSVARAEVNVPTTSAPAELALVPTFDGTKAFKLAYRFALEDSQSFIRRYVDVDATSGVVLQSLQGEQEVCQSIDVNTLVKPEPLSSVMPVTLNTVQQQHGDFDPTTFYVTEYMQPNGPRVFTLDSRGGEPISGVPDGRPPQFTLCPGQLFPNVVKLPGDQGGPSWDPDTYMAAQLQLAGESCINYFANRPSPLGHSGAQWSGMDGRGKVPLEFRLVPNLEYWAGAYASSSDSRHPAILVNPTFSGGAMIDFVCHEFMHGVWDHLGYTFRTPESFSLNESVADIFGSAAEYAVRNDEPSLWCLGPRDVETDCMRWLHAPAATGQPYIYEGPNWCFDGVACDEHTNAGVSNYWFYLLSRGGSTAGQGCGGSVPPLDPDPKKAVDLATEILFVALRDHLYIPDGDFRDLANATISASKQLHGDGALTDTVRDAWHAVNVWEKYGEGADPFLTPRRDAKNVNPWLDIQWSLPEYAADSDIQIDLVGSFDSSIDAPNTPLISRTVPNAQLPRTQIPGGPPNPNAPMDTVGTLTIALEPGQTYYWRVRPHSSEPWGKCDSVHWFTTGDRPAVSRINTGFLEDVPPGHYEVIPEQISGARHFKVQLSEHDTKCEPDPAAQEEIIERVKLPVDDEPVPQNSTAEFEDLQPDHEYWVNVQPIGPENMFGEPAVGPCFAQVVRTRSLDAPTNLRPPTYPYFDYFGPQPELAWYAAPGTHFHRLRFYPIDESDRCDYGTIAHTTTLDELCNQSFSCDTSTTVVIPGIRNPTGYCWDVTAVSTDGHESTLVGSRFYYKLAGLQEREPGVQLFYTENRDPSPIGGDSYDQPVTFSWEPDPRVLGYDLRIGNYPWEPTGLKVPANCYFSFCDYGPADETVPGVFTSESDVEVEGRLAARGRYCWTAWSVLEDPEHPGKVWSRQPFVPTAPLLCYTSGPSEPVITFTHPESGSSIAVGQTIHGTIEVEYVPDGQLVIDSSHPVTLDRSLCEETGPYYRDLYDCVIEFSATGVLEGNDFTISAATYNSPEVNPQGDPPYDGLGAVHEVSKTVHVHSCGALGEVCCPDPSHPCDDTQAAHCSANGVCQSCGGRNQPCCNGVSGQWCNGSTLGCDAGTCRDCGQDKVCCDGPELCPGTAVCVNEGSTNRCRSCGGHGGPCCATGNACNVANDTCQDGTCESPCGPIAPVTITGPVNAFGEPHYADENGVPHTACGLPDLFGKLGNGLITWEVPSTGEPAYYIVTYAPGINEKQTAGSGATGVLPGFQPTASPCGAIGVTVQAVNHCGDVGPIGEESVIYTMWQ
ncbi:M4 family metallopeptidase [Sorangium sp. So ce381]|uniref:M4 family metallopeptidase n=1 Tax=Sorangium sp. So ce381 TaxID=3133307 RepID=UPI003F5AF23C